MKKVLVVGNNDVGLALFRIELIEKLVSEGYEVHFTVPYGDKVPLIEKTGAVYHEIDIDRRGMNPKKDLKLIFEYRKLMSKLQPDLVLTYTIKPNVYAGIVAARKKIPYIATITGLGSSLQGNGKKAQLIKMLYKVGLKKAALVFFQNEENKKFFLDNNIVDEERTRRVNGSGVNTVKYSPETVIKQEHDGVNFLFISRIMRDKGAYEYIEAAKAVKATNPEANFQLLGFYDEDSIKSDVERGVQEGYLEYLGFSKDTRVEMAQADCIVLPSYHEGMSNVLLEGAASGLPLVATDVSGCKETVDDKLTGFLCIPKDSQSLIEAIRKFLSLDKTQRIEMGKKGRDKVISEFDRNIVINSYFSEIKELI